MDKMVNIDSKVKAPTKDSFLDLKTNEVILDSRNETGELDLHTPRDRYNMVYMQFVMCGIGFLFPFTVFTSAVDYFKDEFESHDDIAFMVSVCYSQFNLAAMILNSLVLVHRVSANARIVFGYITFAIALGGQPLLMWLMNERWVGSDAGYYITLVLISICGFGTGVQQSSFYGFGGMFPMRYTHALMFGEGVAGILASFIRLTTKGIFGSDGLRISTYTYFIICFFIIVVCIWCHQMLRRSAICKFYVSAAMKSADDGSLVSEESKVVDSRPMVKISKMPIVRALVWAGPAVFLCYFVSLTLFPGILAEIEDESLGDWLVLILIAIYNFSDFLGKTLSRYRPKNPSPFLLFVFAVLRIAFVPLIILCIMPRDDIVFESYWYGMVFDFFMGLSNGYLGSVLMIVGPTLTSHANSELAGQFMVLMLMAGITLGSDFALMLNKIWGV
eukprot:Nk52_evm43s152 gene=Nk52_evmTU43s152